VISYIRRIRARGVLDQIFYTLTIHTEPPETLTHSTSVVSVAVVVVLVGVVVVVVVVVCLFEKIIYFYKSVREYSFTFSHFQDEHAAFVYHELVYKLPSIVRWWFNELTSRTRKEDVQSYTTKHISPGIAACEGSNLVESYFISLSMLNHSISFVFSYLILCLCFSL
jgi:hypothetical protein